MARETRAHQVLTRLRAAQGAWVEGTELANERVGGSEGLKRLRELRAAGYQIEERHHPEPDRTVWLYRLVEDDDVVKATPLRPPPPEIPVAPGSPRPCPICRSAMTQTKAGVAGYSEWRCASHGRRWLRD